MNKKIDAHTPKTDAELLFKENFHSARFRFASISAAGGRKLRYSRWRM
jgi:hypothetical protein